MAERTSLGIKLDAFQSGRQREFIFFAKSKLGTHFSLPIGHEWDHPASRIFPQAVDVRGTGNIRLRTGGGWEMGVQG